MRCSKAKELISLYLAPRGAGLSSRSRQALEAHMAVCEPCRRDCREGREVMALLRQYWQISADTRALLEGARPQGQNQTFGRTIRLRWGFSRAAAWTMATAACLVLGVLGWWAIPNRGTSRMGPKGPVASSGENAPLVIESTDDGRRVAAGATIQTSAQHLKSLVLNGRHQVAMNGSTSLSVEPLVEQGRTGCLVNLAVGEIYVHVEHDERPFLVRTPYGRAVITGTTFDVKATQTDTTLVVVEGSVRFESGGGVVQVHAGQQSMIAAASVPPSAPTTCDAIALTAWAGADRPLNQVARDISPRDTVPDDLPLFPSAVIQAALEGGSYAQWLVQNRDWFERQFPDIFRLKHALAQDGVEVDYPGLLLESALVWQFAYPPAGQDRLLAPEEEAILRAAHRHGKDMPWLKDRGLVPLVTSATDRQKRMGEAFTLWQNELALVVDSGKEVRRELLLNSLHACIYLRQTRSLVWLAIKADRYSAPNLSPTQRQTFLQAEVTLADRGVSDVIRLLTTERSVLPCDSDPYRQLVRRLHEAVTQMAQTERRWADGLVHSRP